MGRERWDRTSRAEKYWGFFEKCIRDFAFNLVSMVTSEKIFSGGLKSAFHVLPL